MTSVPSEAQRRTRQEREEDPDEVRMRLTIHRSIGDLFTDLKEIPERRRLDRIRQLLTLGYLVQTNGIPATIGVPAGKGMHPGAANAPHVAAGPRQTMSAPARGSSRQSVQKIAALTDEAITRAHERIGSPLDLMPPG